MPGQLLNAPAFASSSSFLKCDNINLKIGSTSYKALCEAFCALSLRLWLPSKSLVNRKRGSNCFLISFKAFYSLKVKQSYLKVSLLSSFIKTRSLLAYKSKASRNYNARVIIKYVAFQRTPLSKKSFYLLPFTQPIFVLTCNA